MGWNAHGLGGLQTRQIWRSFDEVSYREFQIAPDPLEAARGILIAIPIAAAMWAFAALIVAI